MTRYTISLLALAMLALPAFGQSIALPAKIVGLPGTWIIIAPEKVDGGKVLWRIDPALQEVRLDLLLPPEMLTKLKGKVVTANRAGLYRVEAWTAKGDAPSEIATCWVQVGEPTPPVPPIPPDPPKPIPPIPPPDPAPIPVAGFRVLVIFNDAKKHDMPAAQFNTIYGQEFRDYLKAKCVTEEGKGGYAIWPHTTDVAAYGKVWVDAMKRQPADIGKLPWLIVSNGKTGYEGPLPTTTPEIMAVLKKYEVQP